MRILVIRDERCGRLSERVESFLKEKNVDYDVFMASGETKACLVCGQCIKKSTCIIEDDLKKTGGNLSSYDGVMIVTSVFYDRISLPMKNVLVRFARAYLPSLFAKPAIALGISRNGRNGDLQEVVDFFACCEMPSMPGQKGNVYSPSFTEEEKADLDRQLSHFLTLCEMVSAGKEKDRGFVLPPEKLKNFTR